MRNKAYLIITLILLVTFKSNYAQLDFSLPGFNYPNNFSSLDREPFCRATGTWLNLLEHIPLNSNQIVLSIDYYYENPFRIDTGLISFGYNDALNKYQYSLYDDVHFPSTDSIYKTFDSNGQLSEIIGYYKHDSLSYSIGCNQEHNFSSNGELMDIEENLEIFFSGNLPSPRRKYYYYTNSLIDSTILEFVNPYTTFPTHYYRSGNQLDSIVNKLSKVSYTYNSQNMLTSECWIILPFSNFCTFYYYDNQGRLDSSDINYLDSNNNVLSVRSSQIFYNLFNNIDSIYVLNDNSIIQVYEFHYQSKAIGIQEISNSNFEIFPNPVENVLFIKSIVNSANQFEIYNSEGSLVMKGNLEHEFINVSELSSGVYFIKVGLQFEKFIKL